jgi:endonuclease III related protein
MPEPRGIDLLMPTFEDAFPTVHEALAGAFGGSGAECERRGPFEAMIGVLLDRELTTASAGAALGALEKAGLLAPDRLASADVLEIRQTLLENGVAASPFLITPMKQLAEWIVEHHEGRVESLLNPDRSTDWLRGELAAIPGVSLAAADAMLLFAFQRPSYPVDRATYRVLVRHAWLDPGSSYGEARDAMVEQATGQGDIADGEAAEVLSDLARGMVQLGRQYCRAAAPRCEQCPLEQLLPEGGPREADE